MVIIFNATLIVVSNILELAFTTLSKEIPSSEKV